MRQGEGADLLGANDPRGESIGIIYVAPTDDRQSVLTAIWTQDQLGRQQVAVVLPENNRAFQRPIDFDGLKSMRRGLKSEIVFVAPNGPGPAEFARQRRFTVYTSLENYASALRTQSSEHDAKRGWFGRRQKPPSGEIKLAPVIAAVGLDQPASPLGHAASANGHAPSIAPPEPDDEQEQEEHHSRMAPEIGMVGAAGVMGVAAFEAMDHDEDLLAPPPPTSPAAKPAANGVSPKSIEDVPTQTNIETSALNAQRAAEPGIIAFSDKPRPRTTAKLAAAQVDASASPTPIKKSGKRAALIAGTTAAGVGLGAAALASTRAPARSTGTPGGQPPVSGNTGGPGGPGGSGPNQPRRGTRRLLLLLLLLLTILLLIGIAFASPLGHQAITNILPGSTTTATVTITPQSKDVADSFVITAVTGSPNPTSRQVQARIVSVNSPSKSASAHATGSIPGRSATGTLTFINLSRSSITISGGTLTGADGVQVYFAGLTVPPSTINVLGTAANEGTAGNIPALDINGYCCGNSSIFVKNPSGFAGGQNPQTNAVITQNDINSATNTLIAQVKPEAQSQLKGQVRANEDVVPNTLNCTANVKANHAVGDVTPTVTVTGTATCSEEVYDRDAALALATTALKAEAVKNLGAGYAPVNNDIVAGVTQATIIDTKHTVSLLVRAEGVWVFQFSDQLKQQLANAIANKSKSDAQSYLLATTGVSAVTISISNGNTMPAASDITIVIKAIPGPSGSPTLTPGSPTPIIPVTPSPIPTAQNGQGGS